MQRLVVAACALLAASLAGCQSPAAPDPAAPSDPEDGGSTLDPALPVGVPALPGNASSTSSSTVAPAPSDRLHWSGVVDVTESMLFFPWETLTIAPGTVVRFHSSPDGDLRATPWVPQADAYIMDHDDPTGREGYKLSHPTLAGRIHAVGTAAQPILFTSAQETPGYADWNQLTLLSGSRLENVTTEYTHNGITIVGNDVLLANVVARESLWSCIDVFGTRVSLRGIEAYHCWHQAVGFKDKDGNTLTDAFLHDAQVGINCEGGAHPVVQDVRLEAAGVAGTCDPSVHASVVMHLRPVDVAGGTYKGELVYPAPTFG